MTDEEKESITNQVENTIANLSSITVEEIQDVVEQVLMKQGFFDVAKHYIMYRQRHAERREAQKNLMKSYKDIFFADAIDSDYLELLSDRFAEAIPRWLLHRAWLPAGAKFHSCLCFFGLHCHSEQSE